MTFEFNWHDDAHTIIRVDIYGDTTWNEYHEVFKRIIEEVASASHRIDLILNDPNSRMPDGSPMPHIKMTSQKLATYPNMGVIVVVSNHSGSMLVSMMVSIVYRIYRIDTRLIGEFVDTLEKAEASIARERIKHTEV